LEKKKKKKKKKKKGKLYVRKSVRERLRLKEHE